MGLIMVFKTAARCGVCCEVWSAAKPSVLPTSKTDSDQAHGGRTGTVTVQ